MEREEQLKFCRACLNKTFDAKYGVICGLTNDFPRFENTCPDYNPVGGISIERTEVKSEKIISTKNASKELRFVNYLVDSVIASILFNLLLLIIKVDVEALMLNIWQFYAYILIANFLYFFLFETYTGKTPAKYITKTKVVTLDGKKPDFSEIAIRSICRFIPFEAFSFLGIKEYGWHDSISKTRVVEDK